MRPGSRKSDELRKVIIRKNFLKTAFASCLIEMGDTKVLCAVSVEEKVPPFMKNSGKGWLTAEYAMLPASSNERIQREVSKGRPSGRTHEIQRLIGRSLRAVVDLEKIGERTLWIDADVIQADGGTRTASITGSFIALAEAVKKLRTTGVITENPIRDYVAAVSVGIVGGKPSLDLCYVEDSKAEVDMNFVVTGSGRFVEVQGTAEGKPFSQNDMNKLTRLAQKGISQLVHIQKRYVRI